MLYSGATTFLLLLSLRILGLASAKPLGAAVSLSYGTFTGIVDDDSISFRGVPYAEPPVGDLRWRASTLPEKSVGNWNASSFAKSCIATTQTTVVSKTSEDCLYGNIYVPPGTDTDDKLPVLVYFHGGGFESGTTQDWLPDNYFKSTASPLIYVTFAYRLGQFGFLSGKKIKNDGVINAGLLDQRLSLRWVQKYISKFGGDPSRVTIWGQSAGAGSTMFHLIANGGDNEGLFHAAMGDSPSSSFMPTYSGDYLEGIFSQFASFAGCSSDDDDVLDCLRGKSSTELAKAGSQTIGQRTSTLYPFAPQVDGSFITKRPVDAFSSGAIAKVPVFYGANANEGANWSSNLPDPDANTSQPGSTSETIYNFLKGQYASLTEESFKKALTYYPISDYSNSIRLQEEQMYGEARYICTAQLVTGGATKAGQKAYHYFYKNPTLGSTHGAEMTAFTETSKSSDSDSEALFESMRQWWTSFATSQKPSAKNSPSWPAVTDNDGSVQMYLSPGKTATQPVPAGLVNRCNFWHSLSSEIHT